MKLTTLPSSHLPTATDPFRLRLTGCVSLYGLSLGVAAGLASSYTGTGPYVIPDRVGLVPGIFLSASGGLAGLLTAAPLAYFLRDQARAAGGVLTWVMLGLAYGLILIFLTGALLPTSIAIADVATGGAEPGAYPGMALDAVLLAPISSVFHGALNLLVGLAAAVLFATGAWLIDALNATPRPGAARHVPWAAAAMMSAAAVGYVMLASPESLSRLG